MKIREVFECVDMHAAGEPLRIITGGYPPLPPGSVLDRRAYLARHWDHYRRWLMEEPWGHEDMYGCLVVEPERPDSVAGLIFMHNEGYSTMCGHATIAMATWFVESGRVTVPAGAAEVTMRFDVPSGQVVAQAHVADGRVEGVTFENVPAYMAQRDLAVDVDGRTVPIDIGWGGAYYAIVPAERVGMKVTPDEVEPLRAWLPRIRRVVEAEGLVNHPTDPRLSGLYGVIFTDEPADPAHDFRQLTIFADGQADRSPCGSCVSARLAVLAARGAIRPGVPYTVESVLGTVFTGTWIGEAEPVGPYPAVRTTVRGDAYVVGFRRFFRNPDDTISPFLIR
jgi:proline racemase